MIMTRSGITNLLTKRTEMSTVIRALVGTEETKEGCFCDYNRL